MSISAAVKKVARAVPKGAFAWKHKSPTLTKVTENNSPVSISELHDQPLGSWNKAQIAAAVNSSVMLTWAPGKTRHSIPHISHGEGVYLYDTDGKQYLDWTSQAVCCNMGYDLPPEVIEAVTEQMKSLPFVYGGLGMAEIRARLAQLIGEILPGDLRGVVFPSSGSEANEAAIMCARRYTGKFKVINWYRGYHGGTANSAQATGDFRRWFGGDTVPGFVKAFNPTPIFWDVAGNTEGEKCQMALNMLEEQILNEGPDTVAMVQFESIVGAGGVLIPPKGYMAGVRAICDKYDILLHCDEVMVGFGRTGEMFGFQNFEGVMPDIVTSAKGLTSASLPLSMMAVRAHLMEAFDHMPLGWGSTYQAHPVAMAAAYENVKYMIKNDIVGHVKKLAPTLENGLREIAENHPSVKQYRAIGMFGCLDVQSPNGENPQLQHLPFDKAFGEYKKAYSNVGLMGLIRPPLLHVAPPLIINENELLDGLERQDIALHTLDEALGF
mmetsp:Transcript_9352/g.14073  ORF Transcript_9352/g.14073 Transcript_9352/m.14073 type:complete len:495 (-) Transcript_9352:95-1579(-)|eukprot:CAMPEP_0116026308 /NCGR_PEP_ID=MMETSP0321-20121206/13742_1 /TAXON_ID=163516 /ORGANISM="Leptocylindrus danicus var. danicus, Strain B650" /LENGTH=494 /DNA_ID=CAMNT_0003499019 /DNA_START=69 /DNA_END=1553 /DNA_ORIENTATION=-